VRLFMSSQNWQEIDAAVARLDDLITSGELSQHDPVRLGAIEVSLRTLEAAGLAPEQCESLRRVAARYYRAHPGGWGTPEQRGTAHDAMWLYLEAIRRRAAMSKSPGTMDRT
jgi:hypothetical protein